MKKSKFTEEQIAFALAFYGNCTMLGELWEIFALILVVDERSQRGGDSLPLWLERGVHRLRNGGVSRVKNLGELRGGFGYAIKPVERVLAKVSLPYFLHLLFCCSMLPPRCR